MRAFGCSAPIDHGWASLVEKEIRPGFLPPRTRRGACEPGHGMRPLEAQCHLGPGKLHRRTGKRQQAQEHLTTVTTMFREMDVRFWQEKAETELLRALDAGGTG